MEKIILIEDDEKIRVELKNFLVNYNYEVVIMEEFENIVENTLNENPHLILLDINLP